MKMNGGSCRLSSIRRAKISSPLRSGRWMSLITRSYFLLVIARRPSRPVRCHSTRKPSRSKRSNSESPMISSSSIRQMAGCSVLLMGFIQGQLHGELRFVRFALYRDDAAQLLHDLIDYPKAQSAAALACGGEGFEQIRNLVLRNVGAVVGYIDEQLLAAAIDMQVDV